MNRRRFLIFAAFAVWAQCSAVWAQITVPANTPVGLPIVAGVPVVEGSKVAWRADLGSSVVNAGLGRAYLWATPGAHVVQAVISPAGDAEIQWLEASYIVGDPPPTPVPIVKTLSQLAGDKAQALGTLYQSMAANVFPSTAIFKAVHAGQLKALGLEKNGAATEIDKRLSVVLVDPLDNAKLKSVLEEFVAELGSLPPPPPVVEGKRLLVILHETADTTPEQAAIFTAIRTGPFEAYRKSKNQPSPLIYDDEQVDGGGNAIPLVESLKSKGVSLPAMFVIEPASSAVVAKQSLAGTDEAVLAFYQANGG